MSKDDGQDTKISLSLTEEALNKLRQRFFKRLRKEVITWGGETLDLAWTYYPSEVSSSSTQPTAQNSPPQTPRLVVDRVNLPHLGCSSLAFIESVRQEWWQHRVSIKQDQDKAEIDALVGFYGRYLGASGYHLVMEFTLDHARDFSLKPVLWRVDARTEGIQITFPKDEGEVYSQLGAYLDLRQGWQWLIDESIKAEALVIAEVEPGYLIGVRPGNPLSDENPAEREDPEIEEVFSRFDIERFDTLEFLNNKENEDYPFESECFNAWLSDSLTQKLQNGELEVFVLSQSQKFFEAIEEVAERRKIEVSLEEKVEEHAKLIFKRGPISIERDFSLPYLWTLHSGRQHHEGAIAFFRDDMERIFSASELYFKVKRHLERAHGTTSLKIYVEDEDKLIIREASGARRVYVKVSLLEWAAEGTFDAKNGVEQFLTLLGWSANPPQWTTPNHRLSHCPLCEKEARLVKVIRPRLDQKQPKTIGARLRDPLPKHLWGYYALSCPQHRIPIFWVKGEVLHQSQTQTTHQILKIDTEVEVDDQGLSIQLLWGEELVGALLDDSARESLRDRGALYAYAVTPDLIALSMLPISDETCRRLENNFSQLIAQFGPDRDWRLEWRLELR